MLRFSLSDKALMTRSFVVPWLPPHGLVLQVLGDLILDGLLHQQFRAGDKGHGSKGACFWRVRLLVVEPHSRSMVPLDISGMRVCEVWDSS